MMLGNHEIRHVLDLLEQVFPISELKGVFNDFNGHHHFMIKDGKLVLRLWIADKDMRNGIRCWDLTFDGDKRSVFDRAYFLELRKVIDEELNNE